MGPLPNMRNDKRSVSVESSFRTVHGLIADRLPKTNARIYEAGGGSASCVLPNILDSAHVTVVDIDATQLKNNSYADTKILGDIQTHEFVNDRFDLVVCYNVIEHLDAPDHAIERFYQALTPGGLLFIGAPNPRSFSGWVTKLTPHWFHVLFYRLVLGYKDAGKPGSVPFRTVFHRIVEPQALATYCRDVGFNVLYLQEYKGMIYENMAERRPSLSKLLNLTVNTANAFLLWRRDLRNGDYHIILEKPHVAEKTA